MTASLPDGMTRAVQTSRTACAQRASGPDAPSHTTIASAAGLPGGALLPPATRPEAGVAPSGSDVSAGLADRSAKRSDGTQPRAGIRAGWLVPLVVLIVFIPLLVGGRDDSASRATQPTDQAQVAAAPGDLAPIVLPPPGGNAPRVRPVDLILLVDPAAAANPLLEGELATAVEHIARWSMPGDLIGSATTADPFVSLAAATPADVVSGVRATGMQNTASTVRAAVARFEDPTHDHALVVLTATPADWLPHVPSAPAPDPNVEAAQRPAQLRSYVIDVSSRPGTTPLTPTPPQGPTPLQLAADPGTRGAVAEATAKAWVDAIGAVWAGG